jgi:hypothetical protein
VPQVLPERPAQWAPPPTGHNVTLLPDLFYAAYPMSVPTHAQDVPANGTSFQMGMQTHSAPYTKQPQLTSNPDTSWLLL